MQHGLGQVGSFHCFLGVQITDGVIQFFGLGGSIVHLFLGLQFHNFFFQGGNDLSQFIGFFHEIKLLLLPSGQP